MEPMTVALSVDAGAPHWCARRGSDGLGGAVITWCSHVSLHLHTWQTRTRGPAAPLREPRSAARQTHTSHASRICRPLQRLRSEARAQYSAHPSGIHAPRSDCSSCQLKLSVIGPPSHRLHNGCLATGLVGGGLRWVLLGDLDNATAVWDPPPRMPVVVGWDCMQWHGLRDQGPRADRPFQRLGVYTHVQLRVGHRQAGMGAGELPKRALHLPRYLQAAFGAVR